MSDTTTETTESTSTVSESNASTSTNEISEFLDRAEAAFALVQELITNDKTKAELTGIFTGVKILRTLLGK